MVLWDEPSAEIRSKSSDSRRGKSQTSQVRGLVGCGGRTSSLSVEVDTLLEYVGSDVVDVDTSALCNCSSGRTSLR